MKDQVFNSLIQEAVYRRDMQTWKFWYTYTISGIIQASTTSPVIMTIEQDADFLITQITGSVYGPVAANGLPSGGATSFPMPGTVNGFAGRGLSVRINDTGAGRDLTNGYVPCEMLFTPGYSLGFQNPFQVKYYAVRNTKIMFDFRNRDVQANARQQVDVAVSGYKYMLDPTKMDILSKTGVLPA